MIKINSLFYSKDKKEILKNINLTFAEGEITGIIGKSESGKTSLLKTAAGIIKNYEGEIFLNDESFKILSDKSIRKRIAFSQGNNPHDLIDDTLYNFLIQSRKPFKKFLNPFTDYDIQITEDYIKVFRLNDYRDKKILNLSDGVFKKALLASAFIKNADVLLLDNPTNNLDIESISLLQKAILKYSIDGDKIIVIADNDISFLLQNADKILLMDGGGIAAELKPESVDVQMIKNYFNADVLISRNIYNGKPLIHQYFRGMG